MEITPSEELAALVRALYAAMGAGDAVAVEAFYSRDPHAVFVGSDGEEFWTDPEQHNRDVRPYWERAGNVVTPGDLLAFECGEVGWVVDRPTFRLADGQQYETRLTLVLHREDGTWRIVHSHASVGG